MATIIAVYANWSFARIHGIGWGWAGVIWLFSLVTYFPLDILKFIIRFALSGHAWDSMIQNKVLRKNFVIPKLENFSFQDSPLIHMFQIFEQTRLLSQPKRITGGAREKHNGLSLSAHYMASKHQTTVPCSMTKITTENCLKSLSRLNEELRLQGIHIIVT